MSMCALGEDCVTWLKCSLKKLTFKKFKEFFSNRVPKTWNTIPSHIQKSASVNNFKRSYDNWFDDKQSENVIYD